MSADDETFDPIETELILMIARERGVLKESTK